MTERELKRFEEVDLGFCGCGDPVGALELLRDVLQVIDNRHSWSKSLITEEVYKMGKQLDDVLAYKTHSTLALSYLYFIDDAGLLEHGSSIYHSWLSKKGEEVLVALRTYNLEKLMDDPYDYQHDKSCPTCKRFLEEQ